MNEDILMQIARSFPDSDGIYEWAEHFEKKGNFKLTEQNAPVVAWLLVQIWKHTGKGPRRVGW
jgi:hypothetical protein